MFSQWCHVMLRECFEGRCTGILLQVDKVFIKLHLKLGGGWLKHGHIWMF